MGCIFSINGKFIAFRPGQFLDIILGSVSTYQKWPADPCISVQRLIIFNGVEMTALSGAVPSLVGGKLLVAGCGLALAVCHGNTAPTGGMPLKPFHIGLFTHRFSHGGIEICRCTICKATRSFFNGSRLIVKGVSRCLGNGEKTGFPIPICGCYGNQVILLKYHSRMPVWMGNIGGCKQPVYCSLHASISLGIAVSVVIPGFPIL